MMISCNSYCLEEQEKDEERAGDGMLKMEEKVSADDDEGTDQYAHMKVWLACFRIPTFILLAISEDGPSSVDSEPAARRLCASGTLEGVLQSRGIGLITCHH